LKKILQIELNELRKCPNEPFINISGVTLSYIIRCDLKPECSEIIRLEWDDDIVEVKDDRD
jgi:hypothetical protein